MEEMMIEGKSESEWIDAASAAFGKPLPLAEYRVYSVERRVGDDGHYHLDIRIAPREAYVREINLSCTAGPVDDEETTVNLVKNKKGLLG